MRLLDVFRNSIPGLRAAPAPPPSRAPSAPVMNVQAAAVLDTSAKLADFLRNGAETASGAVVTPETAMRTSAVWSCVQLLSTIIGMLPCHLMQEVGEGNKQKAKAHPAYRLLLRKPNGWQTAFEFKTMLMMHLLLRGNGYAMKVMSGGRVIGLLPLHPDRVEPKQRADGEIDYHYTRPGGRQIILRQSDMFHLRFMTMDGVTGITPIRYAKESIGLALQTETATSRMFKHGTMIGGALKVPPELKMTEEIRDNLKQSLEQRHAGADNAHKWMILEEGIDVAAIGMTAADAQFIESRRFQIEDIARLFGVPPYMIGETDKTTANGKGMQSQSQNFIDYKMGGYFRMWEEAAARDLLAEDEQDDHYFKINVNALMRGDMEMRAMFYQAMLGNGGTAPVMTPEEIRRREDLNDLPEAGEFRSPLNRTAGPAEPDR